MKNTLVQLLNDAEAKATVYVKAYNQHNSSKKVLKAYRDAATSALTKYNQALEKDTYREWAKAGNPVLTAVQKVTIDDGKKFSFKTDDDDWMNFKVNDAKIECNLPMMEAVLGNSVFADKDWFAKCQKLCYLVSNIVCERLNKDKAFNMTISDAAKTFNFDGIDPLSDEGAIAALGRVFDAILFIKDASDPSINAIRPTIGKDKHGDIYSPEWTYIRESMTANTDIGCVSLCNTGKFSSYVLHTMHTVLQHGNFDFSCGEFSTPKVDNEESEESEENNA